jgi:hypothetical protein
VAAAQLPSVLTDTCRGSYSGNARKMLNIVFVTVYKALGKHAPSRLPCTPRLDLRRGIHRRSTLSTICIAKSSAFLQIQFYTTSCCTSCALAATLAFGRPDPATSETMHAWMMRDDGMRCAKRKHMRLTTCRRELIAPAHVHSSPLKQQKLLQG